MDIKQYDKRGELQIKGPWKENNNPEISDILT